MLNIFNIQRFSTHDGEGIRTNVFFKGCPLSCPWCSNPESRSVKANLLYDQRLCQGFQECVKASNGELHYDNGQLIIDHNAITDVEKLRNVCPAKALSVAGEKRTVEQILEAIEKDLPFYTHSNGGVTLTGGEPFAQNWYMLDLVKALKAKGIDIAAETSLHMPWNRIEPYVELIDCWLADLKHVDVKKFKKYTGGSAGLVMDNFRKLDALNAHVIVRIPVIPGFNHTLPEMKHIIDFAATLQSVNEVHFMPYHAFGEGKYSLLGMDYTHINNTQLLPGEMENITKYTKSKGLDYKIGG